MHLQVLELKTRGAKNSKYVRREEHKPCSTLPAPWMESPSFSRSSPGAEPDFQKPSVQFRQAVPTTSAHHFSYLHTFAWHRSPPDERGAVFVCEHVETQPSPGAGFALAGGRAGERRNRLAVPSHRGTGEPPACHAPHRMLEDGYEHAAAFPRLPCSL